MCKYLRCVLIIKDLLKIVVSQASPILKYTIKYNYIDTLQDLAFFATSVLQPKIFKIYWPKITKLQLHKT